MVWNGGRGTNGNANGKGKGSGKIHSWEGKNGEGDELAGRVGDR